MNHYDEPNDERRGYIPWPPSPRQPLPAPGRPWLGMALILVPISILGFWLPLCLSIATGQWWLLLAAVTLDALLIAIAAKGVA